MLHDKFLVVSISIIVSLTQSVTNDSTNVTICPNTLVTFTCRSTTGIVVWRTDNEQSSSLTRLGETATLGIFELSVTNVIALDLLVESVASTESAVNDFTLSCHTAVTNGLSSSLFVSVRGEFMINSYSMDVVMITVLAISVVMIIMAFVDLAVLIICVSNSMHQLLHKLPVLLYLFILH